MVEEITKKEDELCGFAPYLTRSRPGWGLSLSRGGIRATTPARVPPPQYPPTLSDKPERVLWTLRQSCPGCCSHGQCRMADV